MDWNQFPTAEIYGVYLSPSLRGRGLKSEYELTQKMIEKVALFTRAWIEIPSWLMVWFRSPRRPLYEGVDWNKNNFATCLLAPCRPLYEGVDWNTMSVDVFFWVPGRPLYEGVDWNNLLFAQNFFIGVALFTRAWIEMGTSPAVKMSTKVALFTRAWIEIQCQ